MVYRKHYLKISIRIILLTATCSAFAFLLLEQNQWLAKVNVILLIAIQMVLLARYHIKLDKNIQFVLNSWKSKDFSLHLQGESERADYPDLYNTLNEINTKFKQVEKQNITDGLLFQYITDHVRIGIVAADENGNIKLFNNAALEIFHLKETPKTIQKLDGRFVEIMAGLKTGQSRLMNLDYGGVVRNIVIKTGKFLLEGRAITLITLDDIHSELQKNEVETWQNLISVLAHEIMNSVAPISALSHKLVSYFGQESHDPNDTTKASDSAEIIQRRSKSLMRFVEDYRKMSGVPLPNKEVLTIAEIFNEVHLLFTSEHESTNLDLEIEPDMEVYADKSQLTHVLINLLLNAYHATEEGTHSKIILKAWCDSTRNYISVIDNGKGISKEVFNKIFIPFFTTRENGSGIGLSLSKQIMSLHGARINVESEVNKGTTITLTFSKSDGLSN